MKITSILFALFGLLGLPSLLSQPIQIEELDTHRSYYYQVTTQNPKSVYDYSLIGKVESWQKKTHILDMRLEVYRDGEHRRKLEVYISRVRVHWQSDHEKSMRVEDSYYPLYVGSPVSTILHLADKHFEFDWYLGQKSSLPQLERYRGSVDELEEIFSRLESATQRDAMEGHLIGLEKMVQHLTTGAEPALFPNLTCTLQNQSEGEVELEGQWLGSPPAELWVKGAIYPTTAHEYDQRITLNEEGTFHWQQDFEKSQNLFLSVKLTPESVPQYFHFHLYPGDKLRLEGQVVEENIRWNIAGKGGATNRFLQAYYDRFKEGKVNTYLLFPGPNESAISKISVPLSQEKGELALLEQFRSEMPPSVYQRFKAEIIYGYAYKKLERNHAKPEDLRWLLVEEILSPQFLALGIDHDQLKYIPAYRRYVEKYLQTLLSQGFWTGDPNWITDLAAFDTAPFHLKGAAKYIFQAHFLGGLTQHYRYYAEYNIRMGQDDILQRIEAFTQKCRDPFLNDQLHELGGFMQGLRIGNRAPDFCLHSLSGNEYCLDFSRGHNVLLLFYRELNQKEITTYNRLQENFPDFHFMYICVDEDEGVWRRKVGEWDLKGIHLHAPGLFVGPSSEYLITGLRKTLLIVDERGRIAENYGLEDSEAQLTAALRRAEIKQQNRAEKRRRYEEDHELDWFSIMVIGLFNLGFMFGLGWLILRWRARRIRKIEARKNEKLELTLRSIRAQMNPHFLFNSLSSIQHLVNSQDNEKANHYLTRFSQLVRKVLQYSEVPLISLQEELDLIRTYAELESLRTPFTLEIDVDPLVDPYTTELPGLLLQPYVENAIRHGLAPLKDRPGRINLTIAKVGYELWITLEDNGIGLEKAKDQKVAVESGGGFGIRLNKERLEALENQWGSSIDVVVEDRKFAFPPAEGTRVEIRLPLEN